MGKSRMSSSEDPCAAGAAGAAGTKDAKDPKELKEFNGMSEVWAKEAATVFSSVPDTPTISSGIAVSEFVTLAPRLEKTWLKESTNTFMMPPLLMD